MSTLQRRLAQRRSWYFSSKNQRPQCRDPAEERTVHATQWKSGQQSKGLGGTPSTHYQQDGQDETSSNT